MKPKIGEAILIGNAKEKEVDNPFSGMFGGGEKITIGGDRSFSHDVWVCLSAEEDRCVVAKLCAKSEEPNSFNFGSTKPYMLEYDIYPISRCNETTLKAMTGYEIDDDLLAIIETQLKTEERENKKVENN
jgi:hypothetical protein